MPCGIGEKEVKFLACIRLLASSRKPGYCTTICNSKSQLPSPLFLKEIRQLYTGCQILCLQAHQHTIKNLLRLQWGRETLPFSIFLALFYHNFVKLHTRPIKMCRSRQNTWPLRWTMLEIASLMPQRVIMRGKEGRRWGRCCWIWQLHQHRLFSEKNFLSFQAWLADCVYNSVHSPTNPCYPFKP